MVNLFNVQDKLHYQFVATFNTLNAGGYIWSKVDSKTGNGDRRDVRNTTGNNNNKLLYFPEIALRFYEPNKPVLSTANTTHIENLRGPLVHTATLTSAKTVLYSKLKNRQCSKCIRHSKEATGVLPALLYHVLGGRGLFLEFVK